MKMRRSIIALIGAGAMLCAAAPINAQEKRPPIIAFGSDSAERGTTRVGYWDNTKDRGAGQFAIDYGRPAWRKDYEDSGKFDQMTKGKVWRLGSNFWTVLDTDIPLKISGQRIPPGLWYLGLQRSQEGSAWSLVFIDPAKARAAHTDASEIERAAIAIKAGMSTEKSSEMREKLSIDLIFKKTDIKDVTLRIAWGNLQLSAPIQVP